MPLQSELWSHESDWRLTTGCYENSNSFSNSSAKFLPIYLPSHQKGLSVILPVVKNLSSSQTRLNYTPIASASKILPAKVPDSFIHFNQSGSWFVFWQLAVCHKMHAPASHPTLPSLIQFMNILVPRHLSIATLKLRHNNHKDKTTESLPFSTLYRKETMIFKTHSSLCLGGLPTMSFPPPKNKTNKKNRPLRRGTEISLSFSRKSAGESSEDAFRA